MAAPAPLVLIPALIATARLYARQLPELWREGPVMIADHTRHDSMSALAGAVLDAAPPHFALAGLSLGGYISFEIMRQAPERVLKLALLDTSARPDVPERTEQRRTQIGLARGGRLDEVAEMLFPKFVHAEREGDEQLRALVHSMAADTGPEAFVRQQTAIMNRPDSRPDLGAIDCPTLVLVGDGDELTPPDVAAEIADGIDGARLVVVPHCGHLSTIERPAEATRALVEWRSG